MSPGPLQNGDIYMDKNLEKTKEKEKKEIEERMGIFLNEANQRFNRLEANISYIGGKISSFFGILLSLISLQATLILLLLNNGGNFSIYSPIFLILFLIVMSACVCLLVCLLKPKDYKDIKLFSEKRFKRLVSCNKEKLLSDFLYHTKKCYDHNDSIYTETTIKLTNFYYLFLIGNLFYIFLIISIL